MLTLSGYKNCKKIQSGHGINWSLYKSKTVHKNPFRGHHRSQSRKGRSYSRSDRGCIKDRVRCRAHSQFGLFKCQICAKSDQALLVYVWGHEGKSTNQHARFTCVGGARRSKTKASVYRIHCSCWSEDKSGLGPCLVLVFGPDQLWWVYILIWIHWFPWEAPPYSTLIGLPWYCYADLV